jgi:hypothetical protein
MESTMKDEQDFRVIADALLDTVRPDMTPKQLFDAARARFPDATKKDIVRAAFYFVIANADRHPQVANTLHKFAIGSRSGSASRTM